MALARASDPYVGFNFLVEIEGLVVGGFNQVSGLQIEIEVESYREGGLNEHMHRLAGPARYPSNLVLRRGMSDVDTLWSWHYAVTQGIVDRRNGSIVLLDAARSERWRWNFVDAFPVRWSGPDLQAGSTTVAVEAVELAHHGLDTPRDRRLWTRGRRNSPGLLPRF